MLDHITLHVSDWERSRDFYATALGSLGYEVLMEFPDAKTFGMGADGKADFWITGDGAGKPSHVAFAAEDEEAIQSFHEAAIAAGGRDNGAPGPRKEYTPGYYAAFVLDPDGNNVEAVIHTYGAE